MNLEIWVYCSDIFVEQYSKSPYSDSIVDSIITKWQPFLSGYYASAGLQGQGITNKINNKSMNKINKLVCTDFRNTTEQT